MARTATRRTRATTTATAEEERADQALMRFLDDGRYHSAAELTIKLQDAGHQQRFSYVLAKVRKGGSVAVLGGDEKATYTSKPTAQEAYRDLKRRRMMAMALLRNALPTAGYLDQLHRELLRGLPTDVRRRIRAETGCMLRLYGQMQAAVDRAGVSD